ncbi:MAG TPA: HK97 family phage prohead protease, partial [Actinomycetota bacterium]|nr:HK97 family phage prohead protease [Actinomycetota bacterium]
METETADGITFDDPEAAVSFTVDEQRRLISGIVVPWGRVARSGLAKWRFTKGSLHWSQPSRIKLNTDHDRRQAIAKAIDIQNTEAGLDATFKVARGAEGDKALALAEDGVLDGFSIEVDFGEGDGWLPDPESEDVRLVNRGTLVGVALTGFPAFDDARVMRVAATRQGGEIQMAEQQEQQEPVALSASEGAVVFDQAMTGLAQKITESQMR